MGPPPGNRRPHNLRLRNQRNPRPRCLRAPLKLDKVADLGGFENGVQSLAFTPGGGWLVVATGNSGSLSSRGDLSLWSTQDGRRLAHWTKRQDWRYVGCQPDGKNIVALSKYNIEVWSLDPLKKVRTIGSSSPKIGWTDALLSSDGNLLVVYGYSELRAIDVPSGKEIQDFGPSSWSLPTSSLDFRPIAVDALRKLGHPAAATEPDGKKLAAAAGIQDQEAFRWTLSPDGRFVAAVIRGPQEKLIPDHVIVWRAGR